MAVKPALGKLTSTMDSILLTNLVLRNLKQVLKKLRSPSVEKFGDHAKNIGLLPYVLHCLPPAVAALLKGKGEKDCI